MTWLLRPLLKPRGSLVKGGRHACWEEIGRMACCQGVRCRALVHHCEVLCEVGRVLGWPARRGTAAQGGRVFLDEVVGVPHEAARRSVVKVVLYHGTPPSPQRCALA